MTFKAIAAVKYEHVEEGHIIVGLTEEGVERVLKAHALATELDVPSIGVKIDEHTVCIDYDSTNHFMLGNGELIVKDNGLYSIIEAEGFTCIALIVDGELVPNMDPDVSREAIEMYIDSEGEDPDFSGLDDAGEIVPLLMQVYTDYVK